MSTISTSKITLHHGNQIVAIALFIVFAIIGSHAISYVATGHIEIAVFIFITAITIGFLGGLIYSANKPAAINVRINLCTYHNRHTN
jgi:hypothetical protein